MSPHIGLRLAFCLLTALSASARPVLRVSNAALGPVRSDTNPPPAPRTLEAYNIGDGSLSLTVVIPPAIGWLSATVGPPQPCRTVTAPSLCTPIDFAFKPSPMPAGTYSANVTILDPDAVDSPQTLIVLMQVGEGVSAVDEYMSPGSSREFGVENWLCKSACPTVITRTDDGGNWLSLAINPVGTLGFSYRIRVAPPRDMMPGTYRGRAEISGSSYDRTVPVTMRVTNLPIAAPSINDLVFRLVEGGPPPPAQTVAVGNSGLGDLFVNNVITCGEGLSVSWDRESVTVLADPGARDPGVYDAVVTIECNAANCPYDIPVRQEIVPRGPPLLFFQGVSNSLRVYPFTVGTGSIAVVKGEQLTLDRKSTAPFLPLPTTLAGATVLVNERPAPLFSAAFDEAVFQMPAGLDSGLATVQVIRDGQRSNAVSVEVAPFAPRIFSITTPAGAPIDMLHPTQAGELLVIWATGLGPTEPPVGDGEPATAAVVTTEFDVTFIRNQIAVGEKVFAGLSPGAVGLYQVIVKVPLSLLAGPQSVAISAERIESNRVGIALR